jgi:predicted amidohydrolase
MNAAYRALALQTPCHAIRGLDPAAARMRMREALTRIEGEIEASVRFIGPDVKLVVLPEYVLTGFPMGETAAEWRERAAIDADGDEIGALAAVAARLGLHVALNAYERDPHFPGLYFQACFLLGPTGGLLLRYRRLISLFAPSPYDVLDRYLGLYGEDALFPVAETALGRIAAIASEEILYPEIARILAAKGAEVFVHSSSETASPFATPKAIAKQARAIETLAYVVSANTAGVHGVSLPAASADGGSMIVSPEGLILAKADLGPSMTAYAEIDLEALRRLRRRPGMANLPSRQPYALYARAYAQLDAQPANSLIGPEGDVVAPSGAAWYAERQRKVIAALAERGVI